MHMYMHNYVLERAHYFLGCHSYSRTFPGLSRPFEQITCKGLSVSNLWYYQYHRLAKCFFGGTQLGQAKPTVGGSKGKSAENV